MSQMRQFDYVPEEELDQNKGGKNKEWPKRDEAYFVEGEARFCIDSVKDGFTKEYIDEGGNTVAPRPKTMFFLNIIDKDGKTGTFTVHAPKDQAWLFRNILNSIGNGLYKKEGFNDNDVIGKNGKLIFGIDEKEKERFGVKNRVAKWLTYDGSAQPNKFTKGLSVKEEPAYDDDIPF